MINPIEIFYTKIDLRHKISQHSRQVSVSGLLSRAEYQPGV